MDRAYEANAAAEAPAPPNPPILGYPSETAPATEPGAWWFHMITEELRALVVAAGIAPDAKNVGQVTAAVQALITSGINAFKATLAPSATTDTTNASNISSGTLSNARLPAAITISGVMTAASYNETSTCDGRLKKNIRRIRNALERVISLRGVTFQWKSSGDSAAGIIAQDLARVIPEGVRNVDGYLRVDPMAVIGLLTEALKEERSERLSLEKRIAKLERSAR